MATLKANLEELFDHVGATKQWDFDDNPNLPDYASEAANRFAREYAADVAEEGEDPHNIADAIRSEIDMVMQQNAGSSMWKRSGHAAESALERLAEDARVPLTAKFDKKKGMITATFDSKAMLRAWRDAVEGQGYSGWGGDEKISDLKSLKNLVGIFDDRAEVYGNRKFKRLVESEMDRFEPDTGSYSELAKIADKAIGKHRRGA